MRGVVTLSAVRSAKTIHVHSTKTMHVHSTKTMHVHSAKTMHVHSAKTMHVHSAKTEHRLLPKQNISRLMVITMKNSRQTYIEAVSEMGHSLKRR